MKTVTSYKGRLEPFLKQYKYQPKLTRVLDYVPGNFDQAIVNQIVLWKVNRYAAISVGTLKMLNRLSTLKAGHHRKGFACLKALLAEPGVDLPMASTLLRFRNAAVYQIIDRHAYRALYGDTYPLYRTSPVHRKIDLYFDYLDALRECAKRRRLRFRKLDRILYVFDKEKNGALE